MKLSKKGWEGVVTGMRLPLKLRLLIIIIINLYAPSPFEVWGAARYLANGEKPSMDKPHAA